MVCSEVSFSVTNRRLGRQRLLDASRKVGSCCNWNGAALPWVNTDLALGATHRSTGYLALADFAGRKRWSGRYWDFPRLRYTLHAICYVVGSNAYLIRRTTDLICISTKPIAPLEAMSVYT